MKVVLKKISRVFKSKIVLVPLIAVALLATGAGIAAVTTREPAVAKSNPQSPPVSSYFGNRGSSLNSGSDTLGQSTTEDPSPKPTPSTPEHKTTTTTSTQSNKTTTIVKVSCNTQQKTVYTDQYNSALNDENSLHSNNQGTPEYAADSSSEDARHANALDSISQNYHYQLTSIHC